MKSKQPRKNKLRVLARVLSATLIAIAIVLIAQNQNNTGFIVFAKTFDISLAIITFAFLLAGFVCGFLFFVSYNKAALNEERKLEWQAQDAKLSASVVSDNEKLLEAKIATLEAALKSALKK